MKHLAALLLSMALLGSASACTSSPTDSRGGSTRTENELSVSEEGARQSEGGDPTPTDSVSRGGLGLGSGH